MKKIDKSTRLTNYLIDIAAIWLVWFITTFITNDIVMDSILFYGIMFLYYLIMEASCGQTLGKMVTQTKVVNNDDSKSGFLKFLMRSTLRLIPLDAFSYLFGTERGLHDIWSSTKLTFIKPKVTII